MIGRHVKGVIVLDTTAFLAAMARVGQQFQRMAEEVSRAAAKFLGLNASIDVRCLVGARNFTGDDLWQSDMCASWLHDSCPLTEACDCTCHGGRLR